MAKITYDVSGVEDSGGGTGVQAPPALYEATIGLCEHRTEKVDGSPVNDLRVAFNVGEEYDWVFYYVQLDGTAGWKLKQFVEALGLPPKGGIDPEVLVGKKLRVKINPGSYGGEYRAQVNRVMPLDGTSASKDPGPDVDDDDDVVEPGDFVPAREGDEGVDSYDDWPAEDVFAEIDDRGLEAPKGRGAAKIKRGIEILREDDAAQDDDADDDDADADDDYDDWTLEELIDEAKKRGLKMGRGKKTEDAVIALLREDDGSPF